MQVRGKTSLGVLCHHCFACCPVVPPDGSELAPNIGVQFSLRWQPSVECYDFQDWCCLCCFALCFVHRSALRLVFCFRLYIQSAKTLVYPQGKFGFYLILSENIKKPLKNRGWKFLILFWINCGGRFFLVVIALKAIWKRDIPQRIASQALKNVLWNLTRFRLVAASCLNLGNLRPLANFPTQSWTPSHSQHSLHCDNCRCW